METIYCESSTRCKAFGGKYKRCSCEDNDVDIAEGGKLGNLRTKEALDRPLTDVESQIFGLDESLLPSSSRLGVKHFQDDENCRDPLGGHLVTVENAGVYHHMFQSLSHTGLLYSKLELRNGDFLLKLNGQHACKLPHSRVVEMFENIELEVMQTMRTWRLESDETVKIEFVLKRHTCMESKVKIQKTESAPSGRGRPLRIQCKGTYTYLKVNSADRSLVFDETTSACGKTHTCHFIREYTPNAKRSFRLKSEDTDEYVGFKKTTSDLSRASLLPNIDDEFYTEFEVFLDRETLSWEIKFKVDGTDYYLQKDSTTNSLTALPKYDIPILIFDAFCSNW